MESFSAWIAVWAKWQNYPANVKSLHRVIIFNMKKNKFEHKDDIEKGPYYFQETT